MICIKAKRIIWVRRKQSQLSSLAVVLHIKLSKTYSLYLCKAMSADQHTVQNSKFPREWGTESMTGAALIWWVLQLSYSRTRPRSTKGNHFSSPMIFLWLGQLQPCAFYSTRMPITVKCEGKKAKQNNTHPLSIPPKSSTVWTLLTDWDYSLPSWEATKLHWNQVTLSTDILVSVITALLCLLFQ